MAQSKILLDSNSYFRLAISIHPLLFQEFGKDRHCLYVLPELDHEYTRSTRLQSKFAWVNKHEYRENRKKHISLPKKERKEQKTAFDFMADYADSEALSPSRVDLVLLSYGYVLGIQVVTDDREMIQIARAFDVKIMKTLELLKKMLDAGHVSTSKVRQVAAYWSYENDRPADFYDDYQRLSATPPPP